MEINLKKIAKISKKKEYENWKFRIFLNGYDNPLEEFDPIVHKLYDQVLSKIDCTKCANCAASSIIIRKREIYGKQKNI